ncbi:MAG: hypothetical protein KC657_22675 [Myxococcales bacterium]|nr:hypothetical protein [Myxococcales bacterium]
MTADLRKLMASLAKLAVLATAIVVLVFVTPTSSDYFAAFADKMALLENKPAPRAIFVGGSGMAFGLDSRIIESSVGRPTVNTGLHAAVGLKFMLERVRPHLGSGDMVVLVPEYAIIAASGVVDDGIVASVLLSSSASLRYVQRDDVPALLRGFPDFALHRVVVDPASALAKRAKVRATYTYTRAGFDDRGDEVGHLAVPSPRMSFAMTFDPDVTAQIERINAFADDLRRRDVKVVFLYPAVPKSVVAANRADLEALDRNVRAAIRVPMTGTPFDAAIDDAEFFDTAYHLADAGRATNSRRIAAQLASMRDELGVR